MKTVQGGLLVALGLGILWLAVTGRLSRLGPAISWIWTGKDIPFGTKPAGDDAGPAGRPKGGVITLSTFGKDLPGTLQRAFS